MKKTLLMSALVVTATTFAATTGNFKVTTEHKATSYKEDSVKGTKRTFSQFVSDTTHKVNLSTEVKLGESGVTLGADTEMNKDLFGADHKLSKLNANAKYDFTTGVEGLNAHIKGNVGAEGIAYKNATEVKVKGEAGVSYKKEDMTYSFMSDTESIIQTGKDRDKNLTAVSDSETTEFSSNHEAKLEGKKGMLKDALLRAKVSHGYLEASKANLELEGKLGIESVKNLTVTGHDLFKANLKDGQSMDLKDREILADREKAEGFTIKGDLTNTFDVKVEYAKDTYAASVKGIVEFDKVKTGPTEKYLGAGAKLEAKYTGVKNLELSADGLFAGYKKLADNQLLNGKIKLGAKAKYDAKVNDKLTLTPALELGLSLDEITTAKAAPKKTTVGKIEFNIKPTLDSKFAASKDVELTSGIEANVKFDKTSGTFDYKETDLKAKLGLEYKF